MAAGAIPSLNTWLFSSLGGVRPSVLLVPIMNEEENPGMALRLRDGLSVLILGLLATCTLLAQSRNPADLGVGKEVSVGGGGIKTEKRHLK